MHIAIATTEFITEPTFSGGLANFSTNLARILRDHGHYVEIFVVADIDEDIMWEKNIYVHRVKYTRDNNYTNYIPTKRLKRHALTLWCLFGKSYVINKRIKEIHKLEKFQLIHFCDAGLLWSCSSKKIPSVVRLSSSPTLVRKALLDGEQKFDYEQALQSKDLEEKVYDFELRKAKIIITPSYMVGKYIKKRANQTINIIESPFCTEMSGVDNTLYDKELKGKKYFLFFGTLNILKGIHTIGQVLCEVFEKYPEVSFVFLGRDAQISWNGRKMFGTELLTMLAGKYAERIVFLPPISQKEQIYSVVEHAELVVLPSRVDNLPNTCIEAMALKKIVIGTDGASFEQLITDGYNGWLCERDNPESLMNKITLAMNMTATEKQLLGERAKARLEKMSPNKFYEKIMLVYQQAMEGK